MVRREDLARSGTDLARQPCRSVPDWPRTACDLLLCSGRDRRRSGDLALFRRALDQLSYPTVAVLTRFELATSALTGRRALQAAPQDHACKRPEMLSRAGSTLLAPASWATWEDEFWLLVASKGVAQANDYEKDKP